MEIYVKMTDEELEEFKKFKETKEIKTPFNDSNIIDYLAKRYKEIEKRDLCKYYNTYTNRSNITNYEIPFEIVSGNKKVCIQTIEIEFCEYNKKEL